MAAAPIGVTLPHVLNAIPLYDNRGAAPRLLPLQPDLRLGLRPILEVAPRNCAAAEVYLLGAFADGIVQPLR